MGVRHTAVTEMSDSGPSTEEITSGLSFPVWYVLACFCAVTMVAWFLLWVVKHTTKAELSVLGVSVGRIIG